MTLGYDQEKVIGKVDHLELKDNIVKAKITVNENILDNSYLAPGFICKEYKVDKEKGIRYIKDVELLEVSVINKPADTNLTKIEEI